MLASQLCYQRTCGGFIHARRSGDLLLQPHYISLILPTIAIFHQMLAETFVLSRLELNILAEIKNFSTIIRAAQPSYLVDLR